MGDSWRTWPIEGDEDPQNYSWGVDCNANDGLCNYPDPHEHGFACERTCPCQVYGVHYRE